MAKREIRMTICSSCIESFPDNDLYLVSRKMHRGVEEDTHEYYTPYCKNCLKHKDTYLRIVKEPKLLKTKKK